MKYLKSIFLILFLVILDQISKFYFFGKSIYIFKYFSITSTFNTGITFGIFKGYNILFIFIILLIIGFVIYLYKKDKKYSLAYGFILAGAFGNLIDRVFRGFVVDFIDFRIWPIFNLADAFVTMGVLLLIYYLWRDKN